MKTGNEPLLINRFMSIYGSYKNSRRFIAQKEDMAFIVCVFFQL
jgi:hypothetical protein